MNQAVSKSKGGRMVIVGLINGNKTIECVWEEAGSVIVTSAFS